MEIADFINWNVLFKKCSSSTQQEIDQYTLTALQCNDMYLKTHITTITDRPLSIRKTLLPVCHVAEF